MEGNPPRIRIRTHILLSKQTLNDSCTRYSGPLMNWRNAFISPVTYGAESRIKYLSYWNHKLSTKNGDIPPEIVPYGTIIGRSSTWKLGDPPLAGKQSTFFYYVLQGHNKSKSSRFLDEMDRVIPWKELVKLIKKHIPKKSREKSVSIPS